MKGGGGKKEQIVGVESSVTWRRVVIATTGLLPHPCPPAPALPHTRPPRLHPRACTHSVGAGPARHEAKVLREVASQRIGRSGLVLLLRC